MYRKLVTNLPSHISQQDDMNVSRVPPDIVLGTKKFISQNLGVDFMNLFLPLSFLMIHQVQDAISPH